MIFARCKQERGQAFVLSALAMVMVCGMAALVLDVGNWYRDKRRLQGTADAAALAGAQMLPDDATAAKATAQIYANKNGGDVAGADIVVTSVYGSDDTIAVKAQRSDEGIFSKVIGLSNVDINARAKARTGTPYKALHVAPMVVYCGHSLIQNCNNNNLPTFNVSTTLDYDKMGAPGAFGMLDLDGEGGAVGSSEEGEWILHGFSRYLGLGKYNSDPGAKFSSSNVRGALDERTGDVLLFPVFRTLDGTGSGAQYDIIGWIGFKLTGYTTAGNNATLTGYFTKYIAEGILTSASPGSSGVPSAFFGVKSIQLIE
ncbi:MAG: pilus assembly protein TadG-related protein [Gaiellaceae bacterium]